MQSLRWVSKSIVECKWFVGLVMGMSLLCLLPGKALAQTFPFGGHDNPYVAGILPNNQTQAQLDAATAAFYDQWKAGYLRPACTAGHYKVLFPGGGTVSEAHGYGMLIIPIMAGYDPDAQTFFDGLYRYYKAHPSNNNRLLMAWNQGPDCRSRNGVDSATDGDLDIAYGLLLADIQWGSGGSINYRQAALDMINAILYDRKPDINPNTFYPLLGDWASPNDTLHYYGTRPSDFMPGHFLAYWYATGDDNWLSIYYGVLGLLSYMQATYSPAAGLVPDFVENTQSTPRPARANFLEGPNDGNYSFNSCRVPMRVGMNFVFTGDGQDVLDPINRWIRARTGGNPAQIRGGYNLSGNPLSNGYELSFAAPFGVGATAGDSQAWLNAVWNNVRGRSVTSDGYYGNTLKLLCMITMSGNWLQAY